MSIVLGPSTIASQFWCEMAVDLKREYGEVSTTEKEKGSGVHKDRLLEVLEEVIAEIKNPADRLHSNVNNMIVGLELFQKEGITRELPVLSTFDEAIIMGVIDEIKLIEKTDFKGPKTQIIEMKTRRSHNPPSSQQILRDRMQGMIYWYNLNNMIEGKTKMGDFWSAYGIDLIENDFNEIVLSEEYMDSLQIPKNKHKEYGNLLSLGSAINQTLKKVRELPPLSNIIQIIYINQKSLAEVHREDYSFDERFFKRGMRWALQYWSGKRDPTSVGEANSWKCDFCSYYTLCPAIHEKWKEK